LVIAETPLFTTVLSVSLANGDGTFKPQQELPISSSSVPEGPLFFGDFNNDGKADIGMLVSISQESGTTSEIAILLGNGDGTFQSTKFVPVNVTNASFGPTQPIVADYNHDGNQDLVAYLSSSTGSGIYVFPGDGKGGFGAPKGIVSGTRVLSFTGGDQEPFRFPLRNAEFCNLCLFRNVLEAVHF
jgi:VCBS repeat protein